MSETWVSDPGRAPPSVRLMEWVRELMLEVALDPALSEPPFKVSVYEGNALLRAIDAKAREDWREYEQRYEKWQRSPLGQLLTSKGKQPPRRDIYAEVMAEPWRKP